MPVQLCVLVSGQAFKDRAVKISPRIVAVAVIAALVVLALIAVPSLGGDGGGVRQSDIGGIRNLEYKGKVKPGEEDGNRFTCPRKTPHAVSGYFVPDQPSQFGKVQLADSFPSGKENRNWDIGVYNPTNETQTYYVGVVCVK
jgi:hypothetical protein